MWINFVEVIVGEENGCFLIGDGCLFEIFYCGGIIFVGIFWVFNYVIRDFGECCFVFFILLLLIINYLLLFFYFYYLFYIFIFLVLCCLFWV